MEGQITAAILLDQVDSRGMRILIQSHNGAGHGVIVAVSHGFRCELACYGQLSYSWLKCAGISDYTTTTCSWPS